jgi:hypothetical protein
MRTTKTSTLKVEFAYLSKNGSRVFSASRDFFIPWEKRYDSIIRKKLSERGKEKTTLSGADPKRINITRRKQEAGIFPTRLEDHQITVRTSAASMTAWFRLAPKGRISVIRQGIIKLANSPAPFLFMALSMVRPLFFVRGRQENVFIILFV